MRFMTHAVAMVFLFVSSAFGQITAIDVSPLAGRLLPTTPPTPAALTAKVAEGARVTYLVSPLYLKTDGAWLGLVDGAAVFPTARPVRIDLTYTYLKPDGTDHVNSYGVALRNTIWSKEKVGGLTLLGSYSDTQDASSKTQLGGVGEFKIRGTPLSASADLRWVRSSAAVGVDDLVPKVSGAFDRDAYSISADYTFKNDVDGENDYSAEIDVNIPTGVLIFGGGKHSTVYVGFLHVF